MNRSILSVLFLVLLSLVESVASGRSPGSQPLPEKEWTVAVYLNADNNLNLFGPMDIEEMIKTGSNELVNLVVLHDGHWDPAYMYYIEKDNALKIRDMGEIDMGDPQTLVSFMAEVAEYFPARHYSLTIWNHGSGWRKFGHVPGRGISWDDTSGNHISTNALGDALGKIRDSLGRKIDVFNMDACLMQMIEVAWACRNSCSFIVTSEESEPGEGAPYDEILAAVTHGMTPEEFARSWARLFVASYDHGSQGVVTCTQSAIRCSSLQKLNAAVNELAETLMDGRYNRAIVGIWNKVQHFALDSNLDLIDLAGKIRAGIDDLEVRRACDGVIAAAEETVIANHRYGHTVTGANGIAISFPERFYEFEERPYRELTFASDSLWDDFLVQFHKLRPAAEVIAGLKNGDMEPLNELIRAAETIPAVSRRSIADEIRFELLSEGVYSAEMTDWAVKLLDRLYSM